MWAYVNDVSLMQHMQRIFQNGGCNYCTDEMTSLSPHE